MIYYLRKELNQNLSTLDVQLSNGDTAHTHKKMHTNWECSFTKSEKYYSILKCLKFKMAICIAISMHCLGLVFGFFVHPHQVPTIW